MNFKWGMQVHEELEEIAARLESHLALPGEQREAEAEPVFRALAHFTAHTLARREV